MDVCLTLNVARRESLRAVSLVVAMVSWHHVHKVVESANESTFAGDTHSFVSLQRFYRLSQLKIVPQHASARFWADL